MADLTMCKGIDCPLKETCYRFKAVADSFRQSYFATTPTLKDGKCDHFWKLKSELNPIKFEHATT